MDWRRVQKGRLRGGLAEYEVYLPLRYNNGRKISQKRFNTTFREIAANFGAESHNYVDQLEGREGKRQQERFCRVWVHARDLPRNDNWFRAYRRLLERRFKQRRIYITKKRVRLKVL